MKKALNILQTIAKYGALFGFGFYAFFFNAAVRAYDINPDANLLDMTGEFYAGMADLTGKSFIPGASLVLHEVFKIATDIVLPGAGMALSTAFNALESMDLAVTLSPAP